MVHCDKLNKELTNQIKEYKLIHNISSLSYFKLCTVLVTDLLVESQICVPVHLVLYYDLICIAWLLNDSMCSVIWELPLKLITSYSDTCVFFQRLIARKAIEERGKYKYITIGKKTEANPVLLRYYNYKVSIRGSN